MVKDVSIIIVTRNGKQVTLDCLKSLLWQRVKEVVLVDNDSSDGTIESAKRLSKKASWKLKVIKNKENLGFALANNQGFAESEGKYVLFLNNDTVVSKNFLRPLLKTLKKHKVAAVQPLILFPDGSIDSVGSFLTPTGFLYHRAHRQMPSQKNAKAGQVYSLKGACMLWKRSVLEKIGVFDESFFAYFEETDLCHRALNYGYKLLFEPKSKITHLGGFTSNKMDSSFVQFHNYKNRLTTYFRHLPLLDLLTIIPAHLALCQGYVLLSLTRSFSTAIAIQKGIIIGLIKGFIERTKMEVTKDKKYKRASISSYLKKPNLGYYKALFSSLEGYEELW